MITNTDELPASLRISWNRVRRDLESIPALESHLTQIQKHGMSVRSAVSIESHFPGLLLPNAPVAYSYKTSSVNAEYSQEAIVDKIKGFVKKGKEILDKLIKWTINKFTEFRAKFNKVYFKQWLYRMCVILENKPDDIISIYDAMQLLRARTDVWDDSPATAQISDILGIESHNPTIVLNLLHVRDLTKARGYLDWLDNESTDKTRFPYSPKMWVSAAKDVISTLQRIRSNGDIDKSNQGDVSILAITLNVGRYRFRDLAELDGRDKQWVESSYTLLEQIEQGLQDTQRKLNNSTDLTESRYKELTTVVNNCHTLLSMHRQFMSDVTAIFNWIAFTQNFLKRDNILELAKTNESNR